MNHGTAKYAHAIPYMVEFETISWFGWQFVFPTATLIVIAVFEQLNAPNASDHASWWQHIHCGEIGRCGGLLAAVLTLNCCREQLSVLGSLLCNTGGPSHLIKRRINLLVLFMAIGVLLCVATLAVALRVAAYPATSLYVVSAFVVINIGSLYFAAAGSLWCIYGAFYDIAQEEVVASRRGRPFERGVIENDGPDPREEEGSTRTDSTDMTEDGPSERIEPKQPTQPQRKRKGKN